MLADFMTMREHKPAGQIAYAFMGDGRFNMARSLLIMGAIMGADVRIVAPRALWPEPALQQRAQEIAAHSGARVTITEDVAAGLRGSVILNSDGDGE